MMRYAGTGPRRCVLPAALLLCLGTAPAVAAGERVAPQDRPAVRAESAGRPAAQYKKWVEEDVVYIISPEEREIFLKLTTDEERDRFIEQFWARRDPNPSTPENEYREEHYRRIQYANQHFHAGIPGWRTDRGWIYIVYGPPDRIESHPAGGQYLRPAHEGGGQTSTYPFERWEYRHLEGIGDDVEIEFVDVSGGNLFELTTDPFKKDELLHVPGMGLTDRERWPAPGDDPEDLRRSRVLGIRDAGSARRMGIYAEPARYSPFARTELAASLMKPPPIRFPDLRAKVEAKVTYDALPFRMSHHVTRLGDAEALVALTIGIPNSALAFKQEAGSWTNRLQVYGRVVSLSGKVAYEFDDEVAVSYPVTQRQPAEGIRDRQTLYRRPLALRPGRYKLEVLVREDPSGTMGTASTSLVIPDLSKSDELKMSPVVLAANLDRAAPDRLRGREYLAGQFRIQPQADAAFDRQGYVAFYFEVYDFAVDPSSGTPALSVEYALAPADASPGRAFRDISRGVLFEGDRVLVPRQLSLASYEPGDYELTLRATDRITGRTVQQVARFTVR